MRLHVCWSVVILVPFQRSERLGIYIQGLIFNLLNDNAADVTGCPQGEPVAGTEPNTVTATGRFP